MPSSLLHLFTLLGLLVGSLTAAAQRTPAPAATARPAASRLALAAATETPLPPTTPAAPAAAPRLACAKFDGQVLDTDGKPLIGATVTVKGTQYLYITNSEGHYLVEAPLYRGQVLEIEAAGYVTRELTLTDCTVPVVGLELAAGTRIKKKGKRAGQVVRFGTADMQ